MRLLHVLPTLDPASGGPAQAVRQSTLALTRLGHAIEIATLDEPGAPFLLDAPAHVTPLGAGRGNYRFAPQASIRLRKQAPRFDAVIVHGLWQYHSFATRHALQGLSVPYYVFAHGMLDPWFKRTYPLKHLKKWLYWPWAEYRVLRDARAVLFTTEEERLLARQSFWLYRARECIVPCGTPAPPGDAASLRAGFLRAYPTLAAQRLILFLGRLHPKKGCDLLLTAFARVAQTDPRLHLVMAGTGEAEIVSHLQTLARELNVATRVTWTGLLQHDLKWGAFAASDAFVLPSHQENFGIAVTEALASGTPVLISDKINIWREVDADEAGFVAADTVDGTTANLRRWLSLDRARTERMREQARLAFATRFTIDAHVRRLLDVLASDRDVNA
ncbi:glycosyltransferase [Trinickia sp. NRRL B-1857]|uniref:glycosyltransferase n=1 Tax=Trinickia sp. NRRL B-1857 TaxID=3162879 RepID=UPI003D2CCF55